MSKKNTVKTQVANTDRKTTGRSKPGVLFPVSDSLQNMPADYGEFLSGIKAIVTRERVKAVMTANAAMVLMYWDIGHSILERQSREGWGARVIDRLAHDLKHAFASMAGFSPRNLKYMRQFCEAWPDRAIVQRTVALLPWRSNLTLLDKLSTPELRLWYAEKAIEYGKGKDMLVIQIESRLHERQSKAQNNFLAALPPAESDMTAQVFKDPYLCEPVAQPREVEQFLHYFCGDAANPNALSETEALRVSFYKVVAIFARSYADIAQDLAKAGYSDADVAAIQKEVEWYAEIRSAIKKHSGEELDIKPFEADMRHLINTYIQADAATELGALGEMSLTELIIKIGIHDAIAKKLNEKGKLSKNAVAEGIINNVRKTIIRDQLTDPRFYAQMSKLLDDLIKQSRTDTAAYEEFLRKAEALVKRQAAKQPEDGIPAELHGKREATVIYNNLEAILAGSPPADALQEGEAGYGNARALLALEIDRAMRTRAPADWKGDETKERVVQNFLFPLLKKNRAATLALFELVKNQPGY